MSPTSYRLLYPAILDCKDMYFFVKVQILRGIFVQGPGKDTIPGKR